jgi:nucleoside-diphosphate-sugar epimerase
MSPPPIPDVIETEAELDSILSTPPPTVVDMMARLHGDIMVLGVAGKMGLTLARMAVQACNEANVTKRIVGIARFSDPDAKTQLETHGVETITCDLLDRKQVAALPDMENIVYMAGRKFGTSDDVSLTWGMNVVAPAITAERFRDSRIAVFSTGNVYPMVPVSGRGSVENDALVPVGEYARSCLGRERVFTFFSGRHGTPMTILRVYYANEPRYGVIHDIGRWIIEGKPVPVDTGHVNIIWQGDANAQALLSLEHTATPPQILNVCGPELQSVRHLAEELGAQLGIEPVLSGVEQDTAFLGSAAKATALFGPASVPMEMMIRWTAAWLKAGGRSLEKPTHFEVRDGDF